MPRRAAKVTQADLARALRAIKDSGLDLALEVDMDGTMRIIPSPSRAGKKKQVAFDQDYSL